MKKEYRGRFSKNAPVRRPVWPGLRDEYGRPLRVGPDPPKLVPIPWNRQILDTTITFSDTTNTKEIKVSDVQTLWKDQNGISVDLAPEFRVLDLKAWETKGNPLVMNVNDLFNKTGYISQLEDDPGKNHWAAVGFRHGKAARNVVMKDPADFICTLSTKESGEIKFRIKILWKFQYQNLPTKLDYTPLKHHPPIERDAIAAGFSLFT